MRQPKGWYFYDSNMKLTRWLFFLNSLSFLGHMSFSLIITRQSSYPYHLHHHRYQGFCFIGFAFFKLHCLLFVLFFNAIEIFLIISIDCFFVHFALCFLLYCLIFNCDYSKMSKLNKCKKYTWKQIWCVLKI